MPSDNSTQTQRLLHELQQGNESVLGELVKLHSPYLRKIIQIRIHPQLRTRVDLSDVEQETRIVIMRRIHEFLEQRPSSFRVWLRSRAIEQLADQYRRHIGAAKRSVRREQKANDRSSIEIARALLVENQVERLHRKELAEQVRRLIEDLSEIDQEILTLRHVEGLSNVEAAEALELPLDTVRKRYGRAIRRLVEKVAEAGLDESISL
jgi:RNA polymerase sigma-70 factor (ECF subfamily)